MEGGKGLSGFLMVLWLFLLCRGGCGTTVWKPSGIRPDKYHVSQSGFFINKMDRVGARFFFSAVQDDVGKIQLQATRPIQIPWGREENFNGVVDLIRQKLLTWDPSTLGLSYEFSEIPLDVKPQIERYREEMLEMLAETG